MLDESYFDGRRLQVYLDILNVPQPEYISVFDKIYGDKMREYADSVMLNRLTIHNGVGFVTLKQTEIDMYKRYIATKSRYNFEQEFLGIKFQFEEKDYDKIVKYRDGLIYFFSNIDKVERQDNVVIKILDKMEFVFDRKEVSRFALIDCDLSYLRTLDKIGTLRTNEREARPESSDNGQMKIAVDAVKACQMIAGTDSKKILVVGSSSEGYGGGRTYQLMDTMFTNSEFFLYDPYEVNSHYVSDNGNKFNRFAKVFEYSSRNLKNYDLVLDDAYVNPENNRFLLDPEMALLKHPAFSCKCFKADHRFFKGFNIVKQVGRTESGEQRAMAKSIMRVKDKEMRFGTCQFCLELTQYVDRDKYPKKFFDCWFRMHPSHYPCGKRNDEMVCGGEIPTIAGDMFAEYEVPPTFCLDYDPIVNCEKVNVLDKHLGWYQFSDLALVPKEFRSQGAFCVYHDKAGCYLTSRRIGTLFPQQECYNMKEYMGLYFKPYKGHYIKVDKYQDPELECVYADSTTLYSKFNFYASVVIHIDTVLYISLPKVRYKNL